MAKPNFKVIFNDVDKPDLDHFFKDRLISLSILDATDDNDDHVDMIFSNPERCLEAPEFGDKMKVLIGYGQNKNLVLINEYILDEWQITRPPESIMISGGTQDGIGEFETHKRRMVPLDADKNVGISLHEILKKIADRYGKKYHISDQLKDAFIVTERNDQSDLQYLHALVSAMDGAVKVTGNIISLVKLGLGKNAKGEAIPPIVINMDDIWNFNLTSSRNNVYDGVIAYYYDKNKSKPSFFEDIREKDPYSKESSGGVLDDKKKLIPGKHAFTMPHVYINKRKAQNMAYKKLDELKRREQKLTFTTIGNPNIAVETPIKLLSGIESLPVCWIVDSVHHSLSEKGFTSTVTAFKPIPVEGEKCPCDRNHRQTEVL